MPSRNARAVAPKSDIVDIEGVPFQRRDIAHQFAPRETPYRFNRDQLQELRAGLELRTNIMLAGPTGCGKTSVVAQLAARLGQPLIRFNLDGEARVAQLRGQQRPVADGGVLTLKFHPGDLAEAMRYGWWLLLDEIDAAPPPVLFVLQSVLEDERTLHIPETGENIVASDGFAVFATGNTVGYRSTARGRHAGTHALNAAFLDRFGIVIAVDYPPATEEIERVLCHVPDLPMHLIDAICRIAAKCREDDKFRSDFSTRRAIQWAKVAKVMGADRSYPAFAHAFQATVIRKLESPVDAQVAQQVFQRVTGKSP